MNHVIINIVQAEIAPGIWRIVCLNLAPDGVTLVAEMRKPFVALAEGLLVLLSRSDRAPVELFRAEILRLDPAICNLILAA